METRIVRLIFDYFLHIQILTIFCIITTDAKPGDFGEGFPDIPPEQWEELLQLAQKYDIQTKNQGCAMFAKDPSLCPPKLVGVVKAMCNGSGN